MSSGPQAQTEKCSGARPAYRVCGRAGLRLNVSPPDALDKPACCNAAPATFDGPGPRALYFAFTQGYSRAAPAALKGVERVPSYQYG